MLLLVFLSFLSVHHNHQKTDNTKNNHQKINHQEDNNQKDNHQNDNHTKNNNPKTTTSGEKYHIGTSCCY